MSKKYEAVNLIGLSKRKLVLINKDKKVLWVGNMLSVNYIKSMEILSLIKRLAL